jgi:hypothetical protein
MVITRSKGAQGQASSADGRSSLSIRAVKRSRVGRGRVLMKRGPGHFIIFSDKAGCWCAAPPNFVDLVAHPTGWGRTAEDATIGFANPNFTTALSKASGLCQTQSISLRSRNPDGARMSVRYDPETKLLYVRFGRESATEQRRAAFEVISNDSFVGAA